MVICMASDEDLHPFHVLIETADEMSIDNLAILSF